MDVTLSKVRLVIKGSECSTGTCISSLFDVVFWYFTNILKGILVFCQFFLWYWVPPPSPMFPSLDL